MTRTTRQLALWALLGLGILAWASNASVLRARGVMVGEPNVLTLKGSPFGRTLAVAMRGPVDVYWHRGESHHHTVRAADKDECAACAAKGHACGNHLATTAPADGAEPWVPETGDMQEASGCRRTLRDRALDQIESWRTAYYTRTNPYGSTELHKAYIMGETEKRLRLSYEMDPTSFSAYGSYFLFLSEALATVKKEGSDRQVHARAERAAMDLSRRTVFYCLGRRAEPAALLTGAAAAHDHAHLLMAEGTSEANEGARYFVAILDACLRDFQTLREDRQRDGLWERIPPARRAEMEVQENLLKKYRNANMSFLESRAARETPQPRRTNPS